jgi:sec-independent protein translocase protein TatC
VLIVSVVVFPFMGRIIIRMTHDLLPRQFQTAEIWQLIQTSPLELMMLELKMSLRHRLHRRAARRLLLSPTGSGRPADRRRIPSGPEHDDGHGHRLVCSPSGALTRTCSCRRSCSSTSWTARWLPGEQLAGVEFINRHADDVNVRRGVQLPLVMTALARARIVPVAMFKKYRRHMWVII